jgi:hypothetical protein
VIFNSSFSTAQRSKDAKVQRLNGITTIVPLRR